MTTGLLALAGACLLAGCGTPAPTRPPAPVPAVVRKPPRPLALPKIPDAPVAFVVPGGTAWSAPLLRSAAHVPALARVAALLRAARLAKGIPSMVFRPGALTVLVSPPPGTVDWIVGFQNGTRITVAPDIARCGASGCAPASGYATLDGAPARAPGLVTALRRDTASLPALHALVVRPAAAAPGGRVRISGAGWVGAAVRLSLDWNGAGPSRPVPVATVPVRGGGFAWTGRLPTDLQAGPYRLLAGDGVRAATAGVTVR